jgi:sulfur carrier protein
MGEISMININFGNKSILIKEGDSLAELLAANDCTEGSYAVSLNQAFIPRSYYATTLLREGDVVDLITPMQGG